jgi:flagellar motor switch protein FliG
VKTSEQTLGAERVAAFLLSLEQDAAAELLARLEPGVMTSVIDAMAKIDGALLESKSLTSLYATLARELHGPRKARKKSETELQQLLSGSLGEERAAAVMAEIEQRRRHEHPFRGVESHPAGKITSLLRGESDAVVALVLAHLEPHLSSEVLAAMEGPRALAIVKRMAHLRPPAFDLLDKIARDLEARLNEAGEPAPEHAQPPLKTIAEMLAMGGPPLETSVLSGLGGEDEKMAKGIREFLFTWNDLAGVDKRGMQKILASIDTKTLSVAIKGSSKEVEANILGNLSSRVREMLADERELAGPMPIAEVEAARAEVMNAVRGLMESGEFKPQREGEGLVS